VPRSLGRNALATLGARAFTTTSQIGILALIAATYGEGVLDEYVVVFSVAYLGGVALDFGAGLYATREVALGRSPGLGVRPRGVLLGALLIPLAWAISAERLTPLEGLSIAVLAGSLTASTMARGFFWGRLLYEREALVAGLEVVLLIALLAAAAVGAFPFWSPVAIAASCYAIGAAIRWLWLSREEDIFGSEVASVSWFREVGPYGLQGLVTSASAQLDIILLSILWTGEGPGQVAAYALALRVYYAAPMPLEALGAALLPRLVSNARNRFRQMIVLGVAGYLVANAAVIAFIVSAPLLGFGHELLSSLRNVLLVLLLGLPMRCACYLLGALVTAQGAQKSRLGASAAALGVMVSLDLLLIPGSGAIGAACALVVADGVLAAGYLLGAQRVHRGTDARLAINKA